MAETNLIEEENQPPGLDYLYSSFFNYQIVQPIKKGGNLWQLTQQNFTVRVETDMETCHRLFEQFSPKKTLFELWGFRYSFYLGYHYQPVFLIFEKGDQPLGLLPLWYESDKDELRWFGSWWQEGNTFWFNDKSLIPLVFSLFRQKILLNALHLPQSLAKKCQLMDDDPKYLLSLEEYPTVENFMQKFNGKKRYNLRRDQKIILSQNPQTVINRYKDLETLFKLSVKRFNKIDDDGSAFLVKERKETFRQMVKLASEYEIRTVTTEINGKPVGVDLVALYKGVYYALNGAYDIKNYPGLGNYTNFVLIQDALDLGMKKIDFLEVSYGWKEDWFKPIPLFQFKGVQF